MSTATENPIETTQANEGHGYAVQTVDLSCSYGTTPVVRNLSLHVPKGSVYALAGPRGAGKTTVLRALATVQQPVRGTILIDGVDAQSDPAWVRGRIGYLAHSPGVYDELTVEEYLDFYGAIYRIPGRRRRRLVGELLELVDLTEERGRPVKSLSLGMKQQLNLARCLVHDPDILLLDDPFSFLDARSRIDLQDLLLELGRLGKTVVMSSHVASDLPETCTHIAILSAGELVVEGAIEEIVMFASPALRLRIRLLDTEHRDAAAQLLGDHPLCHRIRADGDVSLLVETTGVETDLPAILQHLVVARIQVLEFSPVRPTIADLVLGLTEGAAQT
jgi:ABC-2 type transport system ATP-binding protein